MNVVYTVEWDTEPRRIGCEGFEELEYGVLLFDAEGEEMGYVSHDHLVAIEPD